MHIQDINFILNDKKIIKFIENEIEKIYSSNEFKELINSRLKELQKLENFKKYD